MSRRSIKGRPQPSDSQINQVMVDWGVSSAIEPDTLTASSVSDQDIPLLIKELSCRRPRFLFRAWGSLSGGYLSLNTVDAITPLAFANGNGPSSIYNLSRNQLEALAIHHLLDTKTADTVFSSWSTSLEMTILRCKDPNKHFSHISVLDTRQLPMENTVLYVPKMAFISMWIPNLYKHQFLIFGKISGPGLKSVSYADICHTSESPIHSMLNCRPLLSAIQVQGLRAWSVGCLFGGDFAVAVAMHYITLQNHSSQDISELLKMFGAWNVPNSWWKNGNLSGFDPISDDYPRTNAANALLKIIIKNAHGPERFDFARYAAANKNVEPLDAHQEWWREYDFYDQQMQVLDKAMEQSEEITNEAKQKRNREIENLIINMNCGW